jgi:hypothetical protein
MPRFKIKDLMINVVPAQLDNLNQCPFNSCGWTIVLDPPGGCPAACSLFITECGPVTTCGTTACHPAITNTGPLDRLRVEDLAFLKEELRQELAKVESREQELEERLRPQTLEQVTVLEEKLTDALKELQEHKKRLGY